MRKSGFFRLHINNGYDPICNSPFLCYIAPGEPDAGKIQVFGLVGQGIAAHPFTFTIQARDQFGNALDRGGHVFIINIKGGSNPIALMGDNQDGTYTVQWTPAWPGQYFVEVGYQGVHINGSPFCVNVTN